MKTLRRGLRNTITLVSDIISIVGLAVMLMASAFDTVARGLSDANDDPE